MLPHFCLCPGYSFDILFIEPIDAPGGLGAEPTIPQGGQTGIKALTPRGLSISWCFTGIRIIQSCISPEKRRGEERRGESLTGSTTQEQAGQEVRRGFPIPILRPVWLPRMAGDEWAY